nr:hypothetical protein [[Mycobacterium] stephanolepidis]
MAWSLNPDLIDLPEAACPGEQAAIPAGRGGPAVTSEWATELVGGVCDVELFVGVDTHDDLWLGGWCGGGFHCGPSSKREFGAG